MVEGSTVPNSRSGDVPTMCAMSRPIAMPKVIADNPRSEKPFSIMSTRTTSTPMPNPTTIVTER